MSKFSIDAVTLFISPTANSRYFISYKSSFQWNIRVLELTLPRWHVAIGPSSFYPNYPEILPEL
jgi:hypothetical protein